MSQGLIIGGGFIAILFIIIGAAVYYSYTTQPTPTPTTKTTTAPGGGSGCTNDTDCIGNTSGTVCIDNACKPAAPTGRCYYNDDCPNNKYCYFNPGPKPADGLGVCGNCNISSQCPDNQYGDKFYCYGGECVSQVPVIKCDTDLDCDGHPKKLLSCYTAPGESEGVCHECVKNSDCIVSGLGMCGADDLNEPWCHECITDNDCDSDSKCSAMGGSRRQCVPKCSADTDCENNQCNTYFGACQTTPLYYVP